MRYLTFGFTRNRPSCNSGSRVTRRSPRAMASGPPNPELLPSGLCPYLPWNRHLVNRVSSVPSRYIRTPCSARSLALRFYSLLSPSRSVRWPFRGSDDASTKRVATIKRMRDSPNFVVRAGPFFVWSCFSTYHDSHARLCYEIPFPLIHIFYVGWLNSGDVRLT